MTPPRIPPLSVEESAAAASTSTEFAKAEEASLSGYYTAEEIQQRAAAHEHDRNERFRDAFEVIAICVINLGYLALSTLALVWALHLVLPKELRWLSPEDLTHLQTLLTAGILVGVVGNHFKKRLNDTPRHDARS